MIKKPKVTTYYRNIMYESPEEYAFLLWAFELLDNGYINSIERAKSFNLSDAVKIPYTVTKILKTKTKIEKKEHILLNKHIYTPEYYIDWNIEKYDIFVDDNYGTEMRLSEFNKKTSLYSSLEKLGKRGTYIEVKPLFDQNNMTRLFKINQKWMWEKHHIFINLVIPQKLFEQTFTPQEYLKTPTGKDRKITKWKTRTLKNFLDENDN